MLRTASQPSPAVQNIKCTVLVVLLYTVAAERLIMPFLLPRTDKVYSQYAMNSASCQLKRRKMQGFTLPFEDHPVLLQQDTDTATPRSQIPIYYLHSLTRPFCSNPVCSCQRTKKEAAQLLGFIIEGVLTIEQAAHLIDGKQGDESQDSAGTNQPAIYDLNGIPLIENVPVLCQVYGHSWERTDQPGVKECKLCGIRGYCPGCTLLQPANAQPFFCTRHTPGEAKP